MGVRGYVSAYDADSGNMVWCFYTVPGDPSKPFVSPILEKAAKTWTGEWWKFGGGRRVWDSIVYDPELDLLYIGVGKGSPWNQKIRSPSGGDNLLLSSAVALKPDTGEYVWHYQETPGETWDFTARQQIILADISISGQIRTVLLHAPKNGFFCALDRATGALISAKPYTYVNWATGVNSATGRPIETALARYPGKNPAPVVPGPLGAHSWYKSVEHFEAKKLAANYAVDVVAAGMPQDPKIKKAILHTVKGTVVAWDPIHQKSAWTVERPGPWNGGVLSTAGNLVFEGTAAGSLEAYRADTGQQLWSFAAQPGVMAGSRDLYLERRAICCGAGRLGRSVPTGRWRRFFQIRSCSERQPAAGFQTERERELASAACGLSTTPFPAPIAGATERTLRLKGKLKGLITPTAPAGTR